MAAVAPFGTEDAGVGMTGLAGVTVWLGVGGVPWLMRMAAQGESCDCGNGEDDDDRDDGGDGEDSGAPSGFMHGGVDGAHFADLSFATRFRTGW